MKYASIIIMLGFLAGCSMFTSDIQKDPFYQSFFQKTRLIMSQEEIEIYKHLPSVEAKGEFIEDFWEKRDPTPGTPLNENKIEFQERIDYANKWFEEGGGNPENPQGWNTVRGRIYIQLGPPTLRKMGEQEYTDRFGHLMTTRRDPVEIWEYHQFNLTIAFMANQYGEFHIWGRPPAALGRALREARNYFYYSPEEGLEHKFEFDLSYQNTLIKITTPTRKLSFKEEGDEMVAEFRVKVNIYLDFEKIDEINRDIRIGKSQENILDRDELSFTIPYQPSRKGSYYIEAIVTEKTSSAMYRDFTKFRH